MVVASLFSGILFVSRSTPEARLVWSLAISGMEDKESVPSMLSLIVRYNSRLLVPWS